jgi:hypothetical protein
MADLRIIHYQDPNLILLDGSPTVWFLVNVCPSVSTAIVTHLGLQFISLRGISHQTTENRDVCEGSRFKHTRSVRRLDTMF